MRIKGEFTFVLLSLLRYNLHSTKFTYFKYMIQLFLVNFQGFTTITTQSLPSSQKDPWCPFAVLFSTSRPTTKKWVNISKALRIVPDIYQEMYVKQMRSIWIGGRNTMQTLRPNVLLTGTIKNEFGLHFNQNLILHKGILQPISY